MASTILSSPIFMEVILPFLLVFTLVFAVLQKSKILGDGKRQVDALISLAVGLIVVAFGWATNIITKLMPFLAISLVILLVFMILVGMLYKEGQFDLDKKLKTGLMIIITIAVVIAVLVVTDGWNYLMKLFGGSGAGSTLLWNLVFIAVIIGAIALAWYSSGSNK